jgi:spermidine synthase
VEAVGITEHFNGNNLGLKNMLTQEFYQLFEEAYKQGGTLCEAYNKAEKKFHEKYHHNKYKNFSSFNVARYNKIKRELSQTK